MFSFVILDVLLQSMMVAPATLFDVVHDCGAGYLSLLEPVLVGFLDEQPGCFRARLRTVFWSEVR